jgi:hypothetical protein
MFDFLLIKDLVICENYNLSKMCLKITINQKLILTNNK